jgi:DNA polymerase-4
MQYNHNRFNADTSSLVMFVDMNSFFARCEQQANYYLRGRPVGVCVYTGKYGCVIAPSVEAKKMGVKTGMRLNDAMKLCPDLVPVETHPARYREFHVKIIAVLKKYCNEVIPRSIDEAVMDLTSYRKIYKDPISLAKQIKNDIKNEVGEWLTCSIGIAPNAFLAKLATDLQKPDGLVTIMPDNIDEVLSKLQLTDLPGISKGMASRLERGNIYTPLQLRYATPELLKRICKSIVGLHWHYRLNFAEVDLMTRDYKSMQAMRQISKEQRANVETLSDILLTLCMTLERRMMHNNVFAKDFFMTFKYEDGYRWEDKVIHQRPIQDGIELYEIVKSRMKKFQETHKCEPLINTNIISMGVGVTDFIPDEMIQYNMFENNIKKDKLRKVVYNLKDKYGSSKIIKAVELRENDIMKDVIGFGSVKDLHID